MNSKHKGYPSFHFEFNMRTCSDWQCTWYIICTCLLSLPFRAQNQAKIMATIRGNGMHLYKLKSMYKQIELTFHFCTAWASPCSTSTPTRLQLKQCVAPLFALQTLAWVAKGIWSINQSAQWAFNLLCGRLPGLQTTDRTIAINL